MIGSRHAALGALAWVLWLESVDLGSFTGREWAIIDAAETRELCLDLARPYLDPYPTFERSAGSPSYRAGMTIYTITPTVARSREYKCLPDAVDPRPRRP
jgi:hypothetical protein